MGVYKSLAIPKATVGESKGPTDTRSVGRHDRRPEGLLPYRHRSIHQPGASPSQSAGKDHLFLGHVIGSESHGGVDAIRQQVGVVRQDVVDAIISHWLFLEVRPGAFSSHYCTRAALGGQPSPIAFMDRRTARGIVGRALDSYMEPQPGRLSISGWR
jgi:hypothetical protein